MGASFLGSSTGNNFREAVINWYNDNPMRLGEFDKEHLSDWGCQLFDNEKDARRSFG